MWCGTQRNSFLIYLASHDPSSPHYSVTSLPVCMCAYVRKIILELTTDCIFPPNSLQNFTPTSTPDMLRSLTYVRDATKIQQKVAACYSTVLFQEHIHSVLLSL